MNFIVNVIKEQKILNKLSFKEEETFLDIRKTVEDEEYYMVVTSLNIFGEKKAYYNHFDFIYKEDDIVWNPNIDEIIIKDFINTYDIKNIDVYLVQRETGDVSWCPDPEQTIEIVKTVVSFLWNHREQIGFIADLVGITGFFVGAMKKLNKSYTSVKAENYIYSIICKNDWKLAELMKYHKIKTSKEAESILLLFGYKYNEKKHIYHITKKQREYISNNIKTIVINLENIFLSKK